MATILIVDDEENLVHLLRGYLEREGFTVLAAQDGLTALELARKSKPDVVILDLMLPGVDGLEVCRRLRQFSEVYVLMLTAKSEEIDKVVGLSVGADDYVTKPFSPREVVARVQALLRRARSVGQQGDDGAPPVHEYGNMVIDEARHEVVVGGEVVSLTPREFALLVALASHPGRVFTRGQLLGRAWGDEHYDEHLVDVHLANLRKKLHEPSGGTAFVETVRGVGYRFSSTVK